MSKVQKLRSLVNQRLTAAAEEIFGLFERTIAEYEEELSASREENERQRRLLDAALNPEVRLHRADVQQLLVVQEEVPPEQQDWSSSLDQEDLEPPHIKEDQEDLEPPHIKEDQEDGIKFSFTVKSEDDEEEAQSSQLHQRQTEQMETEDDGEEVKSRSDPDGPLEPATHDTLNYSEHETDDSRDWEETQKPQSDLNLQNNEVPERYVNCSTGTTSISSSECAGSSDPKRRLKRHSGSKPHRCSVCGKRFVYRSILKTHMTIHTGEKPFSCSVCGQIFSKKGHLKRHMGVHTGEKPFSCLVCSKKFTRAQNLKRHSILHTRKTSFSCSVCSKTFIREPNLKKHLIFHM